MNKYWELYYRAINFETGVLETFTSEHYIEAINFEDAHLKLKESNLVYLQLTGRHYDDATTVKNEINFYEHLTKPSEIVNNMSLDEFLDWLSLGTEKDCDAALKAFEEEGLTNHVKIIKGYIKHKFKK